MLSLTQPKDSFASLLNASSASRGVLCDNSFHLACFMFDGISVHSDLYEQLHCFTSGDVLGETLACARLSHDCCNEVSTVMGANGTG